VFWGVLSDIFSQFSHFVANCCWNFPGVPGSTEETTNLLLLLLLPFQNLLSPQLCQSIPVSPTLSRNAETDFIDHALIKPCWNWPFYHASGQPCWYWLYLLLPYPAMLKLPLLTTPLSSRARTNLFTTPLFSRIETDFVEHTPFQLCWSWLYWLRPFPAKLKLTLLNTPLSSYFQTLVDSGFSPLYNQPIQTPQPCRNCMVSELFSSCLISGSLETV
jgi:hypothetical protein